MTKSRDLGNLVSDGASSGVATYANVAALPSTGNTAGDLAYVTTGSNSKPSLYIWNGHGWFKINDVNTSPTMNDLGSEPVQISANSNDTITITASDVDEESSLQYKWQVTTGSLPSGTSITETDGTTAIAANTYVNSNQFRINSGSTNGNYTLTFTVTDGINTGSGTKDVSMANTWTQVFSNSNISFANGITRSTASAGVKAFSDQSFSGTETYRYWRFDITALRTSSQTDTAMCAIVLKKASGNNSDGYHNWAIGTSSTPPNQASACKMWNTSNGSEITTSAHQRGGGNLGANSDYYFALVSDDYTPNSAYHKFYSGLPSGASGSAPNYSIIIDAGSQVAATHFNYYVADDTAGRDPKGFTIYGSNVSANFT